MRPPDTFSKRWARRFLVAGRGLAWVLLREPSGRVHAVALAGVLAGGWAFDVEPGEWAVLAVAAGGVIAAEALNTAIEKLADRVSRESEEAIRLVKDVSAGGVLAASIGAAAAGICVFGPRLFRLMGY